MKLWPTDPPDEGWPRRLVPAAALLFGGIVTLVAADLVADVREGTTALHLALEAGTGLLALVGLAVVLRALVRTRRRAAELGRAAAELEARLAASTEEARRWRDETRDLAAGLGAAIARQLDAWALSGAEQEVALLLLKGLSHKEIAGLRGTSEATSRQQARAVYRKAGLTGRSDLASFFLEDLLPAPPAGYSGGGSPDSDDPA
ncbi:MAG: LuxR family transcriptional regulator [bacterium]